MNQPSLPRSLLLAAVLLATAGHASAQSTAPAASPAYPLTTCVVSGDALEGGDMGGPVDYIHKEEGKPDRLVRFCCKSCIRTFKKDPAKYLKMIDAASAKPPVEKAASETAHTH